MSKLFNILILVLLITYCKQKISVAAKRVRGSDTVVLVGDANTGASDQMRGESSSGGDSDDNFFSNSDLQTSDTDTFTKTAIAVQITHPHTNTSLVTNTSPQNPPVQQPSPPTQSPSPAPPQNPMTSPSSNAGAASVASVPGINVKMTWPAQARYRTSEDYFLWVDSDPGLGSRVSWSFAFSVNIYEGYAGLESEYQDGPPAGSNATVSQKGRAFAFVVAGASKSKPGSPGSWCVGNANGGIGQGCRILYPWVIGHKYQFHFAPDPQITPAGWYSVTVSDLTQNPTTPLFTIGSMFFGTQDPTFYGIGLHTLWADTLEDQYKYTCGNTPYSSARYAAKTTMPDGTVYWAQASQTKNFGACGGYGKVNIASMESGTNNLTTNVLGVGNSKEGQFQNAGLCLSTNVTDASMLDGAPAMPRACSSTKFSNTELWVYANDGSLRMQNSFCITVPDAGTMKAGSTITLNSCVKNGGALNQEWLRTSDGKFAAASNPTLCISNGALNQQLVLSPCSEAGIWTQL